MSSSSSKGTHSLRFYNSRKHSKPITARYSRQQLSGRCCTGELEALGSEKASGRRKAFSLRRAPISCVLLVLGRLGLRWYFVVFPGACVSSIGSLFRGPIGSRARDRAAGSYTECAAGTRQPSALRSASRLVHRILSGTPQGQTQLGTLQSPPRVDTGFRTARCRGEATCRSPSA